MRSLVILLDAANSSDIECSEKLHTTECERSYFKRKSLYLFQLDYIQLQSTVSSVTSWKYTVQAVPSKKKKKALKKGRGKENEVEKRRRRKRDGRSLCERGRIRCGRKEERKKGRMRCGKRRKEGRENEGEGERDERRGRERRTENRESAQEMYRPL